MKGRMETLGLVVICKIFPGQECCLVATRLAPHIPPTYQIMKHFNPY